MVAFRSAKVALYWHTFAERKAYFKTKQKAERQFMNGDHTPGDIVSGVLMIGNPFVQIKPFSR